MTGVVRFGSAEYFIDNGDSFMSKKTAHMTGSKSMFYDYIAETLEELFKKMKADTCFPMVWVRKIG